MSVCVQVIYIYICIYLFICRFILCIWMLDFGYCRFPFIPRKAEDAQVSDVYSFLGSKRLVDPVPQQHCHAVPCCAMLCCRPLPSHVLQIWGLRSCRAIMQFFVALGATRKQIARYSR